ncbi:hypothetical protein HYALB_00004767 [Hymenoscyphus albidus]|uniref:P-type Na(+) transporter n=1 Tax=Hymenoscyphus albidus TaxID=595503 RepID=A0A9N9LKL1_9HELO|nr:hypothetical protein HYALB_00004767 [Hymenoscyphus albidus]
MVIIPTTQTDGHSQPVAITGQEGQDPDEPPIPRPPSSVVEEVKPKNPSSVTEEIDIGTASISTDVETRDGGTSVNPAFSGSANTAHIHDWKCVAAFLEVDTKNGLSTDEAEKRLQIHGPNSLEGAGQVSIWEILLRQVSNSLTIVLLIAMALSYGTLDFIEGAVITAVILLNIILGFGQDFRAEKSMQSLLSLAAPSSRVTRDSKTVQIRAENLVIGDIVNLATGDVVPADLRLLETSNLEIDEANLTGESLPSPKDATVIMSRQKAEAPIGDRSNMAYSSTTVTLGRAIGIVVATGMKTEVGNVADLLRGPKVSTSSNPLIRIGQKLKSGTKSILGLVGTPMQIKLSKFAILLFALAILLAIIVFSANKWHLENEVVLYGICVAVAVIPESLIAVMTITSALAVKAMAASNVVIRRMSSLEAIGGVTSICSDKTGTLTQGKMFAHKVWVPKMGVLSIKDSTNILDPEDGKLEIDGKPLDKDDVGVRDKVTALLPVLDAVALCNFATVSQTNDKENETIGSFEKSTDGNLLQWTAHGDPTEIALQVLAMRLNRGKATLLQTGSLTHIMEHQFDSSLKRMSMVYKNNKDTTLSVFAKGATESILPLLDISPNNLSIINTMVETLASDGLRVLCIASKTIPQQEMRRCKDRSFIESNLTLLGLVGLYDPPRPESLAAVQTCHAAGIKVHMLTGDHLVTASSIARTVGILSSTHSSSAVMSAATFDALTDDQIDNLHELPSVIARCSPTTKVRMVDALKRRGAYCVMTGDGVNDAPALKRADVGIAMGVTGTDVAKEAGDMVLTDDHFQSIVKAVEEGRRLFDNIQKFLMHLLISNIAQVILLLISLAFKDPSGSSIFPLSPLEILWVNMITSSFLALGLGMEEAQANIMTRPPRSLKTGVFTRELIVDKMLYGSCAGILCLLSFIVVIYAPGQGNASLGSGCNKGWNESCEIVFRARATVFALLSFLLLITAWEVKSFYRSLFNLDPDRFPGRFSVCKALVYNRFLLWAVVAGAVITFPVVYIPVVNTTVFKHRGIRWEWGVVAVGVGVYMAFVEAWKGVKRKWGIGSAGDGRAEVTEGGGMV